MTWRLVLMLTPQDGEHDAELTAGVLSAISDECARRVLTDPGRFPPDRLLRHARLWLDQPSFQP